MTNTAEQNKPLAFTLIEILVVMAIIGILAAVGITSFMTSQMRGRDIARKSDLKQLASALELYYNDYNRYPDSVGGKIGGCPPPTACTWGESQFALNDNIYIKIVSADPSGSQNYYYRIPDAGPQKYQIYAHLEMQKDPSCLLGASGKPNCNSPLLPSGANAPKCGTGSDKCNYAITSQNTTATER